jgi:hypothetical protein
MALIVEDGSGLSNAESYCSVAFADNYFSNLGITAWASVTNKEAALRAATEYMLQTYRSSWKGRRTVYTQSLDWPRVGVVIDRFIYVKSNIVPVEIQKACAELALKSTIQTLLPDQSQQTIREKVGQLEVEYQPGSNATPKYFAINSILSPFLESSSSGAMARVVRV